MLIPVILTGIQAGALYALLALALVVIYKGTEVVNFAQGDFATLGIYFALSLSVTAGLPPVVVVPLSVVGIALVGALVERFVARPLLHSNHPRRVLFVVIATLAVQVIIQNVIRLVWSPDAVFFPSLIKFSDVEVAGVPLSGVSVGNVLISMVLMILFFLFFQYTKVGTALRAISENPRATQLMGVSVERMYGLSWMISGALAAVAGILLAHTLAVLPEVGANTLIKAFAAAVLGGMHSLSGAIIGAVIIGLLENLAGFYMASAAKEITAFGLIILILMFRPQGVFGRVAQKKV